MGTQLSLALSLRDETTFENFLAGGGEERQRLVQMLSTKPDDEAIYIWGPPGCGRSHLLEAACHRHEQESIPSQCLSLSFCADLEPAALLDQLDTLSVVCLTNIHLVAGRPDWERALFNLYNLMREKGHRLVVSADAPPQQLPIQLADLTSRLSASLIWRLPAYSEEEKQAIICFRAQRLGMGLSKEVAAYLLSRGDRSLVRQMEYLYKLDQASLSEQRRVTIPFVKQLFNW